MAYFNRGRAFLAEHKTDSAISDLSRAISINAELAQAYDERSRAYLAEDRYPAQARAYSYRGNAYRELGQRELAVSDLRRALDLDATDEQSRRLLRALGAEPQK